MKRADRKKIAVITMGIRLENEPGNTRQRYICELLSKEGYEVDLITSTFQHWLKEQRNLENIRRETYPFQLKFVYEPGYKKNVSIQRIKSHRVAAKNLRSLLEKEGDYDLIFSEVPPNDVALTAAQYAKKKGIPFVADITVLWPEAMRMVLDIPVITNLAFYPMRRDAEQVYRLADGIVATSDEYRDRPFDCRDRNIPNQTIYGGNELSLFDAGAEKNINEIYKGEDEFWVTYAGTIGTSQDIKTLVLAAEELANRGQSNLRFKILGNGPLRDELRSMADVKEIFNIEFTGYMSYDKMAAYLKCSDVLVNSFVKKAPQSIPTKMGDYLAAGKPIINTCMSEELCTKTEKDGFGVNIVPEDVTVLADVIEELYDNPEKCRKMGENARRIAVEQFDRAKSYKKIEELVFELIEKNSNENKSSD